MRPRVIALVVVTFATSSLQSQMVQGLAVDRSTRKPLPGIMVDLIDSSGVPSAQARTDSTGFFMVRSSLAGVYRLHFSRDKSPLGLSQVMTLSADSVIERTFGVDLNAVAYVESQVGQSAKPTPGGGPRYPPHLQLQNVEGFVLAQFIVDTLGRCELGTFKVLRATHPDFVGAVRRYLAHAQYVPARIGNRKVRQLVQQPFNFTLTR